jgi:hypothetical protein
MRRSKVPHLLRHVKRRDPAIATKQIADFQSM